MTLSGSQTIRGDLIPLLNQKYMTIILDLLNLNQKIKEKRLMCGLNPKQKILGKVISQGSLNI